MSYLATCRMQHLKINSYFLSFERDRAPFVLTSDMAYVINGGEKPTIRFQLFVDLCCQAYNLIRKQANLFLNLLSLVIFLHITDVNKIAFKAKNRTMLTLNFNLKVLNSRHKSGKPF